MAGRTFLTPGEVPELTGNPAVDMVRLHDFIVQLTAQLEYVLGILQETVDGLQ